MSAWLAAAGAARGATATFPAPALDRWMYPFNGTPGTRTTAATFGNVGADLDPDFDQRDGQFLLAFRTSQGGQAIPAGQGAAAYAIQSATLSVTVAGGSFSYDPTYDSYRTYLPPGTAGAQSDGDTGRPVELYGVGFRNGYTSFSFTANDNTPPGFEEATLFSGGDGFGARSRSAYAAGGNSSGQLVDVSNNVLDGFEPTRFAIGATSVAVGASVPAGTRMNFALDVSQPLVRSYLQQALNVGVLGLAVTSLHPAEFGGLPVYPIFATRENTSAGFAPSLAITYTIGGCPNRHAGDFNCDRVVSPLDYIAWRANYGLNSGATPEQGDGSGDGRVSPADYTIWANNLGATGASLAAAAVPEPAAWWLAACGAALVALGRRVRGDQ